MGAWATWECYELWLVSSWVCNSKCSNAAWFLHSFTTIHTNPACSPIMCISTRVQAGQNNIILFQKTNVQPCCWDKNLYVHIHAYPYLNANVCYINIFSSYSDFQKYDYDIPWYPWYTSFLCAHHTHTKRTPRILTYSISMSHLGTQAFSKQKHVSIRAFGPKVKWLWLELLELLELLEFLLRLGPCRKVTNMVCSTEDFRGN